MKKFLSLSIVSLFLAVFGFAQDSQWLPTYEGASVPIAVASKGSDHIIQYLSTRINAVEIEYAGRSLGRPTYNVYGEQSLRDHGMTHRGSFEELSLAIERLPDVLVQAVPLPQGGYDISNTTRYLTDGGEAFVAYGNISYAVSGPETIYAGFEPQLMLSDKIKIRFDDSVIYVRQDIDVGDLHLHEDVPLTRQGNYGYINIPAWRLELGYLTYQDNNGQLTVVKMKDGSTQQGIGAVLFLQQISSTDVIIRRVSPSQIKTDVRFYGSDGKIYGHHPPVEVVNPLNQSLLLDPNLIVPVWGDDKRPTVKASRIRMVRQPTYRDTDNDPQSIDQPEEFLKGGLIKLNTGVYHLFYEFDDVVDTGPTSSNGKG